MIPSSACQQQADTHPALWDEPWSSKLHHVLGHDLINGVPWWYFDLKAGTRPVKPVVSVDPKGQLLAMLPSSRVVGAAVTITADRIAPGVVRSLNPLGIEIGELDDLVTERTVAIASILSRAGIDTNVSDRIRDAVWSKAIVNLVSNPLSVVSGATLDTMINNPELREVCRELFSEGAKTAGAFGASLKYDFDQFAKLASGMGAFKTSMLQDYERGSTLELAAICDAVIELGRSKRIFMPLASQISKLARFKSTASNSLLAVKGA